MTKKYMIVRIVNILAESKYDGSMVTEPCYVTMELDHDTLGSAYLTKEGYREPSNYIVVEYWC